MTPDLPPDLFFLSQLQTYWQIFSIKAACELGLADCFNDGPQSAAAIASAKGLDEKALLRLLRALADCGIFVQTAPGVFAHSERSQLLRSDLPQSFKWMVLSEFGEERVPAWLNLPAAVQSGQIAFDQAYGGKDIWAYYREHPAKGELFNRWMTGASYGVSEAIHAAFDFSKYRTVVDVGGGFGAFLSSILDRNPATEGILYDLPQVIAQAPDHQRLKKVGGDAFVSVPAGGDLYTLKWVLHDWEDSKSLQILANIRQAMLPAAQLMVIENVILEEETPAGPDFAKWLDINMMVMTGGHERTEAEYRALLAQAGFQVHSVTKTGGSPSLLLAS